MEIIEVDETLANIVGIVHSAAWKDTYIDIFDSEYVNQDKEENRKQECLNALENKNSKYFLILIQHNPAGIIKISFQQIGICEIESLYFLKEHRGKGYGTQACNFLKKEFANFTIVLWVLEQNTNAVKFYKKNGFKLTNNKRVINRGREYYQDQYMYSN